MKSYKKIISTLLAAAIVAGSASLTFAKSYNDVKADDSHSAEISILSDLGVIVGTSENEFSPDANVTREQMATLLFRLMLGRDDAGRVNTTHFTDLYEPYYNGAISWAAAAGYIKGVSDDRFNPTGGITKQDAMTMLVRALGQSNDNMNSGYPWSYINVAARLGLDKGLEDVAYTQVLTRAETAQIIYNALVSDYVVTKNQNGAIVNVTTTIIENVFGYTVAEAQLVATNDYSMTGETVVKNGYVTMLANDGGKEFMMTIPADSLHMDGDANENLGRSFKVIYRADGGKYAVLSSVKTTDVETHESAAVNKNGTVTIGDKVFTLVEKLSDELLTNNNELMLYNVKSDGKVELVTDPAELDKMLGFFKIELMNDNGKINIGIIKTYEVGTLMIDKSGNVNLANGKNEDDINMMMPEGIKNGDTVLYRYNDNARELEVSEILESVSGTVVRITGETVMIGSDTYTLGNERAGISADVIKQSLKLGQDVTVLVHDGAVITVVEGKSEIESGKYMISLTDAHLVYENGSFRYVMSAYVDGKTMNVYVSNADAKAGNVYRYTERDGIVTLVSPKIVDNNIVSGAGEFIQSNDEIGFIVSNADNTTIEFKDNTSYVISAGNAAGASSNEAESVQFVCDNNTVIIVNDGGVMKEVDGKYASTIKVSDGASVVAVMKNEVGSVETLRYLYISNGSLGNYAPSAETVRVLAKNGMVYSDGKAYTEYTVYNFADSSVKVMISRNDDLAVGSDYRIGNDGTVTSDAAEALESGKVNGYTAGTITIDDKTYNVGEKTKIVVIREDGTLSSANVAGIYNKTVEYVHAGGEVTFILVDETKGE